MKTTLELFQEVLLSWDVDNLSKELSIHRGTIKRWIDNNKVPDTYFNDFNRLLGFKYPVVLSDKDNDCYFTSSSVAKECIDFVVEIMKQHNLNPEDFIWLEPSAGNGAFYKEILFEKIGIDINPLYEGIKQQDFLTFIPNTNKKYVVIGNPPFGLRGNLALKFINKASEFADIVAFILPPLFDSDGKGSPKKRIVHELSLIETKKLTDIVYTTPSNKKLKIPTIFQIWSKCLTPKQYEVKSCDEYIKIYSLSDGGTPSSTRNKHMIGKCDVYIPSTCFEKDMRVYSSFEELPNKRGYGIVFIKHELELKKMFYDIDLLKYSFRSTNSSLNMRSSIIKQILFDNGFVDKQICVDSFF
jgi:hypothetical protein